MKTRLLLYMILLLQLSFGQGREPGKDGHGAYTTKHYRNLFLEQGHTPGAIDAKIEKAFQQLFHGDTSQRVYFVAGANAEGPLAYISDVNHHDVRSEGISYGMMICVQRNRKEEFDALWNWAMTYMYVTDKKHPTYGYFKWSLKTDGSPNSETAAPDGEEYMVMALYFAAHRWGEGSGIYRYHAMADSLLTRMRHREDITGMTRFGPRTTGAMMHEGHRMIRFVPDQPARNYTDPSYHLPAFYELWARWGPEADCVFWAAAADSSRAFFARAAHPVTGLTPDYANFDGTPHPTPWNPMAGNFSYDSWRTAMNWSVDWSWWRKEPGEQELSNRLQTFFARKGLDTYGSQFTLDGNTLNNNRAKGLISTNAVASLASTLPLAGDFTEALWNLSVPESFGERYYHGLLYLMSLMHCSGDFVIWE